MRLTSTFALVAVGLLSVAGCGENGLGGGAYQQTSVVVLPPDLGVALDEADAGDESSSSAGGASSSGSGPGNLAGRVILTGGAPALGPIFAKGAPIKDADTCSAQDMPDERLVLGSDNGVANVFIYIQKVPKGSPKPVLSEEAVVFDQKYCRFIPHCLVVPTGQEIKVLSDDDVGHNTHTYPAKNGQVNQSVEPGDREGSLRFTYNVAERQPVRVVCDFHSWMSAWHLPVDHPYVALTDADGNFEIKDLPAGDHVFTVWHEAAKGKFVERKLKVTIKPGETTNQEIEYAASKLEL